LLLTPSVDFKISYFKMGPTELRILLCIGNLAFACKKSVVHLFGRSLPPLRRRWDDWDFQAWFADPGDFRDYGNTMRLYQREPLPTATSAAQGRNPLPPVEILRRRFQDDALTNLTADDVEDADSERGPCGTGRPRLCLGLESTLARAPSWPHGCGQHQQHGLISENQRRSASSAVRFLI